MSRSFDLIVVGGGIAGLATAELFARSGFKVCIVEKNSKLCEESSGQHHEWFHFGSLYSVFHNPQYLRTLVGGIDDLLLFYSNFPGMNISLDQNGKLATPGSSSNWFQDEQIQFVFPLVKDKTFKLNSSTNIHEIPQKFFTKLAWLFTVRKFMARHNRFHNYNWHEGSASHYIPRASWGDYSSQFISELNNPDINFDPRTHRTTLSHDRPMSSFNIISDLTRSFISNEGRIITNRTFINYMRRNGSVNLVLDNGESLLGKKIIFSVGKNIGQITNQKIKARSFISPLLVTYPAVCSNSFVYITPSPDHTINHLHHTRTDGQHYSLIGSSYAIPEDKQHQQSMIGEQLTNRALQVFPKLKDASVRKVYYGTKTEIISKKKKRNYLYHIEQIEDDIFAIIPGKFSLAFSLAFQTFEKLEGREPNRKVYFDQTLDVSQYVPVVKHRSIVDNISSNEEN